MTNKTLVQDCALKGIIVSILWHFFCFFIFTPAFNKNAEYCFFGSSIFLGNILKDSDFVFSSKDTSRDSSYFAKPIDKKQSDYFTKDINVIYKPKAPAAAYLKNKLEVKTISEARQHDNVKLRKITFGLNDYTFYLDRVDFNELKRVSSREDLSSFIHFQVLLSSEGMVRQIRKIGASGDPALDLYVMRKLKMAIFRDFFDRGAWVDIYFKLKD